MTLEQNIALTGFMGAGSMPTGGAVQHGAGGYDVLIARGLLAQAGRRVMAAGLST